MQTLAILLILLLPIVLFIGLLKPSLVLRTSEPTRGKVIKFYGCGLIVAAIVGIIVTPVSNTQAIPTSNQPSSIEKTVNAKLASEPDEIFNQVVLKCPGLAQYQDDYLSAETSSNGDVFYDGAYQTGLKSLKIKVKDRTDVIPAEFRAWGHTCEYTFTKNEDRLIISKDPCISICEAELIENHGENYEKY